MPSESTHTSPVPGSITPILHNSISSSVPHVSQHERPELVDVRRFELAPDRSVTAHDLDRYRFPLGDFAEIVNFDFVQGMFDQRVVGFLSLIHAAPSAEFHQLTVHG